MAVEGMSAFVCGACTCVSTPAVTERVDDHYRARLWGGPPRAELNEQEDGSIRPGDASVRAARHDAKLQALRAAIRAGESLSPRVVQVGCRDGDFLAQASRHFAGMQASALEPWHPWRQAASARGLSVRSSMAETHEANDYDIVIEFDLLDHFSDPVTHLAALARLTKPGGHILLGVSSVVACAGLLTPHRLRLDTPVGFTPRALQRACGAAGLAADVWEEGATLFAVCERGERAVEDADPGAAPHMVLALRENDGRLLLKRILAEHGPSDAVLRAAETAARSCRTYEGRRTLCEDVGRACDRAGRHDDAIRWFIWGRRRHSVPSQNVA